MEHTMCSESSSSLHSIQHSCCTTKGAMSRSPTKWYLYLWPFCHLLHWVRAQQSYCSTAAAYGHPSLAHSPPFVSRLWIQNLGRVRPRSHRSGPDSRTCLRHYLQTPLQQEGVAETTPYHSALWKLWGCDAQHSDSVARSVVFLKHWAMFELILHAVGCSLGIVLTLCSSKLVKWSLLQLVNARNIAHAYTMVVIQMYLQQECNNLILSGSILIQHWIIYT